MDEEEMCNVGCFFLSLGTFFPKLSEQRSIFEGALAQFSRSNTREIFFSFSFSFFFFLCVCFSPFERVGIFFLP